MSTEVSTTNTVMPQMYEAVDNSDRQLPSVYLLQGLSQAVQNGIGKSGEVIVGLGADDPHPTFLIGGDSGNDSFTAYILDRRRSYARFEQGGQMEWLTKEEYDEARANRERDVWVNHHYTICVPDVDETVPMRLMLSRTAGLKPSKALNFLIDKNLAMGQIPVAEFSVGEGTSRTTGAKYATLQVSATEGTPEGTAVAANQQSYFTASVNAAEDTAKITAGDQPDF